MKWEPYDRHWIRLRGPWKVVRLDPDGAEGIPESIRLPSDWSLVCQEGGGVARFSRRFQRPTHLDADERVTVTMTNVNTDVKAALNGRSVAPLAVPLGDPECWPAAACRSFDVSDVLEVTNMLSLELRLPSVDDSPRMGLHEPVLLEIVTLDVRDV